MVRFPKGEKSRIMKKTTNSVFMMAAICDASIVLQAQEDEQYHIDCTM